MKYVIFISGGAVNNARVSKNRGKFPREMRKKCSTKISLHRFYRKKLIGENRRNAGKKNLHSENNSPLKNTDGRGCIYVELKSLPTHTLV